MTQRLHHAKDKEAVAHTEMRTSLGPSPAPEQAESYQRRNRMVTENTFKVERSAAAAETNSVQTMNYIDVFFHNRDTSEVKDDKTNRGTFYRPKTPKNRGDPRASLLTKISKEAFVRKH